MTTRRNFLLLAAGTAALSGCGGSDNGTPGDGSGDGSGDGGNGGQGPGLDVEAFDTTVAPSEEAVVEVSASSVAALTWQISDLPEDWQVNYDEFDPEPTAVQESYPPTLIWDPAVDEVSGVLRVSVSADATPDTYILYVEGRSGNNDESITSEAGITVES